MARATLLEDRGLERDYKLNDGNIITLRLQDDFSQITFWNTDEQLGSNQDFAFIESSDDYSSYLLARMYVPKGLKRNGLGRACIEFFKEYTGANVHARPHDGIRLDDGSHLTEDAPAFVSAMQEEGLVERNSDYEEYDNEC